MKYSIISSMYLENMVYEIAENMNEYDASVRWWGNSMIVTGSKELHRRVQ